MKTLADYKDDEAIDVWMDMLDPIVKIMQDKEIATMYRAKKPYMQIIKKAVKKHKKDVEKIVLAIDDTPITATNFMPRLVGNVLLILNDKDCKGFFVSQAQTEVQNASAPATETTEGSEN